MNGDAWAALGRHRPHDRARPSAGLFDAVHCVGHNRHMTLRWAKSASKHGISPARTRYVIETYLPALKLPPELPDRLDE